jgi:general secretion pathway protein G
VLPNALTRCVLPMGNPRAARSLRRARSGFTLIEILVVLAIIATLAALVGPSVFRNVGDSRTQAAKTQLELFALALEQYRLDNHVYPTTEQGLTALRAMPVTGEAPPNWRGPYLRRVVPDDPWKRPYVYVAPGRENRETYDLYSLGRDGRPGGEGEDTDVTGWGGPVRQ